MKSTSWTKRADEIFQLDERAGRVDERVDGREGRDGRTRWTRLTEEMDELTDELDELYDLVDE